MKFALLLCVSLACLAIPISGQSKEDAFNQFYALIDECKKTYPASDESIYRILKHLMVPQTQDEKCLSGCVMSQSGMIANGRISVEGWRSVSQLKWNSPANVETSVESAQYCYDQVQDDDICELAGKALACVYAREDEVGLPPPDTPA